MELAVALGALIVAGLSLALQLLHMRRDPNVPEL